jgi:hypothetical protein
MKLAMFRQKLQELPEALDEAYGRILLNIPKEHVQEAHATLKWLAFSKRPMLLGEISEAIIVEA